jgi:hypothetical protein
MAISILCSVVMVWFITVVSSVVEDLPLGIAAGGRGGGGAGEGSGEKNASICSIPKALRWPVSLTVKPVFLRAH